MLAARGMRPAEAARALGLSPRTASQHLARMRDRADAATLNELVARCYAAGIIRTGTWPPAWTGRRCLSIPAPDTMSTPVLQATGTGG